MIPVGQHAEPLEILALARHLLARIFTAFFTKGPGVELVANLAVLLLRSEEHTSELQSLMRISYAVFCLKKKKQTIPKTTYRSHLDSIKCREQKISVQTTYTH